MRLSTFLAVHGLTALAFSRRVPVSHTTLSRLMAGKQIPRAGTRRRIVEASGRLVTDRELVLEGAGLEDAAPRGAAPLPAAA